MKVKSAEFCTFLFQIVVVFHVKKVFATGEEKQRSKTMHGLN